PTRRSSDLGVAYEVHGDGIWGWHCRNADYANHKDESKNVTIFIEHHFDIILVFLVSVRNQFFLIIADSWTLGPILRFPLVFEKETPDKSIASVKGPTIRIPVPAFEDFSYPRATSSRFRL